MAHKAMITNVFAMIAGNNEQSAVQHATLA
jgi:hypothetical protein